MVKKKAMRLILLPILIALSIPIGVGTGDSNSALQTGYCHGFMSAVYEAAQAKSDEDGLISPEEEAMLREIADMLALFVEPRHAILEGGTGAEIDAVIDGDLRGYVDTKQAIEARSLDGIEKIAELCGLK